MHKPSVISISWGGPENSWSQRAMTALDQAFQAAALNDVTAGNNGAFAAAKDWDACTGLGSPNGVALSPIL